MKNVLLGIAAGAAIGYAVRKMADEGRFDHMGDNVSDMLDKTKKKFKNVMDKGTNQAEYVADRVEHYTDKAKKY